MSWKCIQCKLPSSFGLRGAGLFWFVQRKSVVSLLQSVYNPKFSFWTSAFFFLSAPVVHSNSQAPPAWQLCSFSNWQQESVDSSTTNKSNGHGYQCIFISIYFYFLLRYKAWCQIFLNVLDWADQQSRRTCQTVLWNRLDSEACFECQLPPSKNSGTASTHSVAAAAAIVSRPFRSRWEREREKEKKLSRVAH